MNDVACFCGCWFSFDGGAAACPWCGEIASVTAGPAPGAPGRGRPKSLVPVMREDGQNGQAPEASRPRAAAVGGELAGRYAPVPGHG